MDTGSSRSWRLVVVDDEPPVRDTLAALLACERVRVSTAGDRAAAERLLAAGDIDLLLTDLRLGASDDASGFELVRWLHARLPHALIVVLTAYASEPLRAEARRLGAVDLWSKSLAIPELVRRLRGLGVPLGTPPAERPSARAGQARGADADRAAAATLLEGAATLLRETDRPATRRPRKLPRRAYLAITAWATAAAGAAAAAEPPDYLIASTYETRSRVCVDDAIPPLFCGTISDGEAHSVAIGDLDSDGDPDIVQARENASAQICLNNGQEIFACQSIATAHAGMTLVALGDLNVDGRLDIVLGGGDPDVISAQTCFNAGGNLFFCGHLNDALPFLLTDLAAGDVDGDGAPDLVATVVDSPAQVCLNDGEGVFDACLEMPSGTLAKALALGDVDLDGHLDVAVATALPGLGPQDRLCLGNGAGLFACSGIGFSHDHHAVAMGDLDGDGGLDVIFGRGEAGTSTVYCPGDGSGSFPDCFQIEGSMDESLAIAAADLDGDGKAEAGVASAGNGGTAYNTLCRFHDYAPPLFGCYLLDSGTAANARDVALWTEFMFRDGFEIGHTRRWLDSLP